MKGFQVISKYVVDLLASAERMLSSWPCRFGSLQEQMLSEAMDGLTNNHAYQACCRLLTHDSISLCTGGVAMAQGQRSTVLDLQVQPVGCVVFFLCGLALRL